MVDSIIFHTFVDLPKFYGSTKKWNIWNQNFMDPQKNEILGIKILWIHKKMKYLESKFYGSTKKWNTWHQNFMDPQKNEIFEIKILWIHKKKLSIWIKILWIHKMLAIQMTGLSWATDSLPECISQNSRTIYDSIGYRMKISSKCAQDMNPKMV
jgi:hypothetical protein